MTATLTDTEFVEDVAFMADAGVGLREAARRSGSTVGAIERRLYRLHEHGLVARMRAADPAPANTVAAVESRYVKWRRTPLGRRVLADAAKWLDLTAASWPDDESDQERRRVDVLLETWAERQGGVA